MDIYWQRFNYIPVVIRDDISHVQSGWTSVTIEAGGRESKQRKNHQESQLESRGMMMFFPQR